MAARALTDRETVVLAHVVLDPVAWWTHVCGRDGSDGKRALDAEAALAEKVAKGANSYDAALAADGADYKNRVARDAAQRAIDPLQAPTQG
jgi:hypothetical protein